MADREGILRQLATALIEQRRIIGWEYRDPPQARPFPLLSAKPVWHELPLRPTGSLGRRADSVTTTMGCLVLLVISVGSVVISGQIGAIFGDSVGRISGVLAFILSFVMMGTVIAFLEAWVRRIERRRLWLAYAREREAWEAAMQSWGMEERIRTASADLWYPVVASSATQRIDVFGGTPDGWAALVATMGAGALSESSVTVLDFTEHDVAHELIVLVSGLGRPASRRELASVGTAAALLRDLSAEDFAEVISETISMSRTSDARETRGLIAQLIRVVAQRLDGDLDLAKVAAGLRVLCSAYDPDNSDSPLSEAEISRLTAQIDLIGAEAVMQKELRLLVADFDLLADLPTVETSEGSRSGVPFGSEGVSVWQTTDTNRRRKHLLDRMLVQCLLHRLRARYGERVEGLLFVAGGDHVGLEVLEELSRQATRVGVRTVFLLEHLRGDLQQLLGGAESGSAIMRLGNAQEAAASAEYIGKGHKFVLSQLSYQHGDSISRGESHQWGEATTESESRTESGRMLFPFLKIRRPAPEGWSRSQGFSEAVNWSGSRNLSNTVSSTMGMVHARVSEFTIEPTRIQSMPSTAFMFVESEEGRRRVVAVDCNPLISLLDRVASTPRGSWDGVGHAPLADGLPGEPAFDATGEGWADQGDTAQSAPAHSGPPWRRTAPPSRDRLR